MAGSALGPLILSAAFFLLLVVLTMLRRVPISVLGVDTVLSAVLFGMYYTDKSAALHGRWRTSEASLHILALLGGWPGALIARRVFRHKTRKQPFVFLFWCTVVGNCLAIALAAVDPNLLGL